MSIVLDRGNQARSARFRGLDGVMALVRIAGIGLPTPHVLVYHPYVIQW